MILFYFSRYGTWVCGCVSVYVNVWVCALCDCVDVLVCVQQSLPFGYLSIPTLTIGPDPVWAYRLYIYKDICFYSCVCTLFQNVLDSLEKEF